MLSIIYDPEGMLAASINDVGGMLAASINDLGGMLAASINPAVRSLLKDFTFNY